MGSYPACLLFVVYNSPNITLTSFHPNKPQSAEARTPAAAPIRTLLTQAKPGITGCLEPEPTAIHLGQSL